MTQECLSNPMLHFWEIHKQPERDEGLFFVGIDVINGMLSEINVTSPTGLREIENLSNKNVSDKVIEKLMEII